MSEEEKEKGEEELNEQSDEQRKHGLLSSFLGLQTGKIKETTDLNERKAGVQWRQIMHATKSQQLLADLQKLKEKFLKTSELKDAIISALDRNKDDIEFDCARITYAHMTAVQELLAAGEKRANRIREQYVKDMTTLRECFLGVLKQLQRQFGAQMTHFEELDRIEDEMFKNFKLNAKTRFSIMHKDIDVEITREKDDIIAAFDKDMINIWQQFQCALVKYFEDADSMEQVFAELKQEYEKSMQDMMQDRKVTEELQKSIPQLRTHIEQREKDYKERLERLLTSQETFYGDVHDLKVRMCKTKDRDKISLTNLVINSTAAIRELQKLNAKGERIMRLYRRCEKLESEAGDLEASLREPCLTAEEMEQVKKCFDEEFHQNSQMKQAAKDFEYVNLLQGFWEKLNQVVLQNIALKREMSDLQVLNMKLKSNVNNFFKKVSEHDMDSLRQVDSSHKPVVQEAALLVKSMPYHSRKR